MNNDSKQRQSAFYVEKKKVVVIIILSESTVVLVHFTVLCLVTWPLSGIEAGVDLVLIKTPLLFT